MRSGGTILYLTGSLVHLAPVAAGADCCCAAFLGGSGHPSNWIGGYRISSFSALAALRNIDGSGLTYPVGLGAFHPGGGTNSRSSDLALVADLNFSQLVVVGEVTR